MRFRPHTFQRKPLATEISPCHFSCSLWELSQLSRVFVLPTSHIVVKCFLLSVSGYKASIQVVFSWLFQMISLQFSCNSRFVLGGSQCSLHLLLCHLGLYFSIKTAWLSLSGQQNPCCFSQLDVIWVPFWLWCSV